MGIPMSSPPFPQNIPESPELSQFSGETESNMISQEGQSCGAISQLLELAGTGQKDGFVGTSLFFNGVSWDFIG